MELDEAIEVWRAKAPVCLCADRPCSPPQPMCGPQRKATRAARVMLAAGMEAPLPVRVGLEHAFTGEGRGEFDRAVSEWLGPQRRRLGDGDDHREMWADLVRMHPPKP